MNSLWGNVFDYFKERRSAAIFFVAFAVALGVIFLGTILGQAANALNLMQYWPLSLPGFGLLLLAFAWRVVRQQREQRGNRYKSSPLSRDEWVKARSKLATKKTIKRL